MAHVVTHEPDNMTTVWTATVVSSGAPGGLTVGQYSLDRFIANENWTIYGLETEVMPIPGAQAFRSGYVNAQTTVTHGWDGTFAKYVRIFSVPRSNQQTMLKPPSMGRLCWASIPIIITSIPTTWHPCVTRGEMRQHVTQQPAGSWRMRQPTLQGIGEMPIPSASLR